MEQYQLKGEELLYLAAKAGAEQFYGVKDVLIGLPENERRLKIFEVEKNLSEKKYIQEDFDGNIEIEKKIKKVISVCAFFQSCLFMEGIEDGVQNFCYYFIKDGEVYSMKQAEGVYVLESVDGNALKAKVHGIVKKEMAKAEDISEFLISMKEMERITTLIKHGAGEKGKEQFIEAGADTKIAAAIVDAIEKKADFRSLVFIEQSEERIPPYHLMFVQSEVLLKVEYRMQDYDDYMCFFAADTEEIEKCMDIGLKKLDIQASEDFV